MVPDSMARLMVCNQHSRKGALAHCRSTGYTWEFRKGGGKQRPAAEEKLAPFLNVKMAGIRMVHQKLNVI